MYANAVERLPQDILCNAAAELSYKLLFKSSIDRRWSAFTEYWRQRSLTRLHLTRFHCTLGHRLRSYITTHKHAYCQITKNRTLFTNSNWSVKTPVNHTTTTIFTALFLGPPGWAGARRELLDFMVHRKINRGRHTDHLAGRHSIRTNQCPPPPSHFLQAGCPSCRPTNSVKALKATENTS